MGYMITVIPLVRVYPSMDLFYKFLNFVERNLSSDFYTTLIYITLYDDNVICLVFRYV